MTNTSMMHFLLLLFCLENLYLLYLRMILFLLLCIYYYHHKQVHYQGSFMEINILSTAMSYILNSVLFL